MWELVIILMFIAALVVLLGPRLMGKRGIRGELAHGTLLITGLSPRPDAEGEQFVTINGVISGPTVNEHPVYQRMAVDVNDWPSMGDLIPVVYSPKNPDNWRFAPPQQQMPPGAYEPPAQY